MRDSPATQINLDELGDYKILGELAGREDARAYLASRREDDAPVLIAIAHTPTDDEGNALSLLAADTNLLATLSHRNLLRVLEGRWIGNDAFAVVLERVEAPTLDELLAREELPFPRIAAILREVNGLLEWAREHKIVHRAVTTDTLFVENGSDRVLAAFAISPIPFGRVSPVGVDARTIGTLAKAMLAQHSNVANRVIEQTDALLQLSHTSETVPDIPAYIASIAMADALKQGEIEYEKMSHAIEEEQRLARERLEAEQQQHERAMAEQRQQFEKQREQFQRELEKERRALLKEREALAKERAEHQKDREALMRERTQHQRERAERERAERERDREREVPIPLAEFRDADVAPADLASDDFVPLAEEPERVEPVAYAPLAAAADTEVPTRHETTPRYDTPPSKRWTAFEWRTWPNAGILAGAVVLIAVVTSLAVGAHRHGGASSVMRDSATSSVAMTSTSDSAGGEVVPSVVPLPASVPDSVWTAAAAADSDAARAARRDRAERRAAVVRREAASTATNSTTNSDAGSRPATRADTSFNLGFMTPFARDPAAAPRRDTVTKPVTDSAVRRDTLRKRDSLPPRDSTPQ